MRIRKVKKEDFDAILDIQLQLEDAEAVFDDNLKKHCYATEEGMKILKKRISKRKNIFFVAVEDNKVVGFIDGYISDDEWWYIEKCAYISHLCIDKDYRKRGFATSLMTKFEETAKSKGAKFIKLLAFPENKPAISLYSKSNYKCYSSYYSKKLV